jgi:competence protein ComEC
MCRKPVGEGAKRVTTADRSVIGKGEGLKKVAVLSTPRSRGPRWPRLRFDVRATAAALWAEIPAQAERWFLWSPVAFGAGAAAYFALKYEPRLDLALAAAVIAFAVAFAAGVWGRSRALAIGTALLAFGAAGFAGAALKTAVIAAPMVPANLGVATVEGWVADVASPSAGRARLLIAPVRIPPRAGGDARLRPHGGEDRRRAGAGDADPDHRHAQPAARAG